ncbi:MAG TPA: hypothetical protein VN896_11505 [Methylomirabilota bacterium]|jgi:hypothetical protein|nr:hypothetical protein [Methylomirabilota bacterium]
MRSRIAPVSLLLLALAALAASAAKKGAPSGDIAWAAPDIDRYAVSSVAMLPPATYDGSAEARKLVEQAVGQALKGSGHRWVSPFLVRDVIIKNGGDSLAKAINDKLLKDPRVDSLDAPLLSRMFRARALLTVRVDEWERRELEANQSGRPSTSIQLRAALVDSTGRLLWTLASNETVEGAQQDAGGNVIGVKSSGLNTQAIGTVVPAPTYPEVLAKMALRWTEAFPRRAAPDSSGSAR